MKPLLLPYPGNEGLADGLRRSLEADALDFELRQFPDGETFLRVDSDVRGRAIIVVSTLVEPDSKLLPLIFITDTLRELGAVTIGLVAPYLAYMRQDCRFNPGEAVTSASFARVLSSQFDWLATVDPHLHRRSSLADIYTIPAVRVQAAPLLSAWIRSQVDKPLLIGPDAESEQWVSAVAAAVPCPHIVLAKIRSGDREVAISAVPDPERWIRHTPVLVDDIISTGGTLVEAVKRLVGSGMRAPICLAVHGVFATDALTVLRKSGVAAVVTTNTIAHPSNGIDVVPLLVDPVKQLLLNVTSCDRRQG